MAKADGRGEARPAPTRSIDEHGVVGDMRTAALVAADVAIAVLCWPDLDGPTILASLLDPERGGAFELAPGLAEARASQIYVPETNVLLTRWL